MPTFPGKTFCLNNIKIKKVYILKKFNKNKKKIVLTTFFETFNTVALYCSLNKPTLPRSVEKWKSVFPRSLVRCFNMMTQ